MEHRLAPSAPILPPAPTRLALPAAPAHPGHGRLVGAAVVAVLAIPVLVPGLIDPVEGALPVLLAGMLLVAAWLLGRVPMPPLAWIAWGATVVSGAATLVVVGLRPELTAEAAGAGPFALPPAILVPLIAYELGVVATIIGSVWYASRVVRRANRHRRAR